MILVLEFVLGTPALCDFLMQLIVQILNDRFFLGQHPIQGLILNAYGKGIHGHIVHQ